MKELFMFPDKDAVERIHLMEALASDVVEDFSYQHVLEQEEVDEYAVAFTELHQELAELEARKKAVVEEYAAKIKGIKNKAAEAMDIFENRRIRATSTVYLIPNFDDGLMCYYNKDGRLVHDRPLKVSERQRTIGGMLRDTEVSIKVG